MSGSYLNSTEKQDLEMTYKWTEFNMGYFSFISVNGPLIALTLMANIFFGFCLTTRKTQQVKQPLKILLGFAVSTAILYSFSVPFMNVVFLWVKSPDVVWASYSIVLFTMNVNMTSYVWLMFYYYIKIVPSQRALFLWVKQNIKSVIYVLLFVDRLMFLSYASFQFYFGMDNFRHVNGTFSVLQDIEIVLFSLINVYKYVCLCVIMISSCATAHYLNKHMKSLAASGGSIFKPRNHIRVIVTGIIQGVLYFFYAMWIMLNIFIYNFPPYVYFDFNITLTISSLNISITTVNLGVGQTLFRERAVHVWKAVKKRVCTRKMSEDPRSDGDNLTTLATIESILS